MLEPVPLHVDTRVATPPAVSGEPADRAAHEDVSDARLRIQLANRAVPGGRFILDAGDKPAALWGDGDQVAWVEGEPLMLNGPTGVGKTTIAQQLILARVGLRDSLLGMTVQPTERRVLYIAADRPAQAARSLRRMVTENDRAALDERLEVWRGPLPVELVKHPDVLVELADEYGADTIVVDSLKDVVAKLTDDESANRANQAFQACSAAGVDLAVCHHQRKATGDNRQPTKIDDVYGSTWITAGMGSVLLVWGAPGDLLVELTHLKQPAEPIGPWRLLHDHQRGTTTIERGDVDLISLVATSNGLTAGGAARALFRTDDPKPNDVEKARRRLNRLVELGVAHREGGDRDPAGKVREARYYAIENRR